jgi:electron transfer flavoprotein alpha subunit
MLANNLRRAFKKPAERNFSSLIIAEQFQGKASENIRNVVNAASQFGEDIHVLLHGKDPESQVAGIQNIAGVSKILLAKHDSLENASGSDLANIAVKALADGGYKRLLTPSTNFGKDFIPRVAKIDSQPITDVIKIIDENTFQRPVYAGNAIATVESSDKVKLLTVRPTNFDSTQDGSDTATSEEIDISECLGSVTSEWVENMVKKSDRPELASSKYVVSGGRGLKNGENFDLLYTLADTIGEWAVGASRAAVDAGYVPNELQVGQTGKVVAPDLYIAVGLSGAIQHIAGMKDSKVIVAINKDPEAPIFEIANYGIVGDLFKIVPELTEKLAK